MTPERWKRLEDIYHAAHACPAENRAAYLAEACGDDAELQCQIASLLVHGDMVSKLEAGVSIGKVPPRNGDHIGPYRVEERLAAGGMGVVYRATDTRLGREVAIKIGFEEFSDRFHREARAIAALNHPNVCTLHDIGSTADVPAFLVMEFVEGDTLANKLQGKPLPLPEVLQIGRMMASALAAAHARGIVHRDLKPANVKITPDGAVKVLDFGLAKGFGATLADQPTDVATMAGTLLGTAGYMSPEQAAGKNTDARSDIFSFGIVLYEMLAGRRPFEGSSVPDVMAAILKDEPEPLRRTQPAVPEGLDHIVAKCLRKNPEDRYASAAELHQDLDALTKEQESQRGVSMRTMVVVASLLVVVTAGYFGAQSLRRQAQLRWLEETAVPEITRLLQAQRSLAALKLYRQAERIAPESKLLFKLAAGVDVVPVQFDTTPPGAKIYISDYTAAAGDDLSEWQFVGTTPVTFGDVPFWGYYRLRAVKEGFAPADQVFEGRKPIQVTLKEERSVPPGMVWIPEGRSEPLTLPGFWLDRYEVTNQQYREFLDGGGYQKAEYWTEFISHVTPAAWKQAMARFHDQMNRPGPAGWILGTYAEGKGNHPVAGVSWYEAAAFCRSAGKALPTLYEWRRAAPVPPIHGDIMLLSNFGGRGTSPAGERRGMAVYGAYDMAGNVIEWAANAVGPKRYALGGGWDEFSYVFVGNDARDPLDRFVNLGFRCVKRVADPPPASFEDVVSKEGPVRVQKAVGETEYQLFLQSHQDYDRSTPLESSVDQTDDTSPFWKRLKVSFEPVYAGTRVVGHLFLPKDVRPPYQAIIMFGGSGVMQATRLEDTDAYPYEFIVRSGRAVLIPAYSGTLERGPSDLRLPTNEEKERSRRWYWDLVRSVDYLDSREDIDIERLGFYGISWGAAHAPRLLALDTRFKAAAFMSGGLLRVQPPEVDSWNFAPHYRVPTIMINGRHDVITPLETSARLLFNALGTPDKDKTLVEVDGGHANPVVRPELLGKILDWFDDKLGPVESLQVGRR